ncbi:MAG: hypothetical protein HGB11_03820 [Chlorobiales bacterium]|nr:hypothetical protein [Chlorobiales bacterium]
MTFFIVTSRHRYTVNVLLEKWVPELANSVSVITYDDFVAQTEFPVGTYVFADVERLSPYMIIIASAIWDKLSKADPAIRLYNHPGKSMRRYELLKTLYKQGQNKFRAFRLTESLASLRFPVFLRGENDHYGSASAILHSYSEFESSLRQAFNDGRKVDELLAVEYINTADEAGLFRKYSGFVLGDLIIPRHVAFSYDWMVKYPSVVTTELLKEEKAYLDQNPHESVLRKIFKTAGIEYGRIDYSIMDGALQVWEINTNPTVLKPPDAYSPEHRPIQWRFAHSFQAALMAINNESTANKSLRIQIDSTTLRKATLEKLRHRLTKNFQHLFPQKIRPALMYSLFRKYQNSFK